MTEQYPLISVLVLCFNNQNYIYENLQSIFDQKYPNIEILIGDDASDNFDSKILIEWINRHRTPNIHKISIFENPTNLGTVKNLENLQKEAKGDYLFNIAADDVLFDSEVLVSLFNSAILDNQDYKIIVSETEMWDQTLTKKTGDFLGKERIKLIKEATPLELFTESSWHSFFPACFLYSKNVLGVVGVLSDKYSLIEDWPFAIRVFKSNIKPIYCDIQSSIKHRDGGISHGNTMNSALIGLKYYRELYEVYVNEVKPSLYLLNGKDAIRATTMAEDRFRAYYKIQIPKVRKLKDDSGSNTVVLNNTDSSNLLYTIKRIAWFLKIRKVMYICLAISVLFALFAWKSSEVNSNLLYFTSTVSFVFFQMVVAGMFTIIYQNIKHH